MKKYFKMIGLAFVSLCMFFTLSTDIQFQAEENNELNDETGQPEVSYKLEKLNETITNKDGFSFNIVKLTATINENAGSEVLIDLSDAVNRYTEATGRYNMPGDSIPVVVEIINNSKNSYQYMPNSFALQGLPVDRGYITNAEPILSLVDVIEKNGQIELDELLAIYTRLEEKGFTGENALTNYILNYWQEAGYQVQSVQEMFSKYPEEAAKIFGKGVAQNPMYTLTSKQVEQYKQESELFANNYKKVSGNKYSIMWPEDDLATATSSFAYDNLFNFGYDKDFTGDDISKVLTKNSWGSNMAIKDYYTNANGLTNQVNEKFSEIFSLQNWKDNKNQFSFVWAIDGPHMGNAYMNCNFVVQNTIKLVSCNLSVTKTIDLNGSAESGEPTFMFIAENQETKDTYVQKISFKEGETSKTVTFENIPAGTYKVTEIDPIRYSSSEVQTVVVGGESNHPTVNFYNTKDKDNDFSDTSVVVNSFKKADDGTITISKNNE